MEEREGVGKGGGQSKGWERGGVMEAEGGMMRFPWVSMIRHLMSELF